jgi:hypothetical protein
VVTADGYTLLATLQMLEDQRIKGLLNLRRGWKTYKEILAYAVGNDAVDPAALNTLKFGSGLFYFLLSLVPPGIAQKAAALAGFSGGDKKLGLDYLRECHNSTSIRSHLAGIVLSLNHLFFTIPFEDENAPAALKEVDTVVQEGIAKFKNGSLFYMFGGIAALEKNETDEALKYSETAIKNALHIVEYPAVCMRLQVNCHLMRFDWKSASETIEQIVAQEQKIKSKYTWATTWNAIRGGACFAARGEKDKSMVQFKIAMSQKGSDVWSTQLRAQAAKFTRMYSPFSIFELMYLTAHFLKIVTKNTDERRNEILALVESMGDAAPGARKSLADAPRPPSKGMFSSLLSKKEVENLPIVDNRAFYLILKSTVLISLKKNDESEACVREITSNAELFANDKLYLVLAHILNAKSIASTRREAAVDSLKFVMKQTGFVWENNLKSQAKRLLERFGEDSAQDEVEVSEEDLSKMELEESEEIADE